MSLRHFIGVVLRALSSHKLRAAVFLLWVLGVGALVPQTAQALTIHITGTSTASGVVGGNDALPFSLQVADAPVPNSECTVQGTGIPGPWSGPGYHWDPPVVSDTGALSASLTPDPATTGSVTLHLFYLKTGDYTVKLHATLGFRSSCGDATAEDFKTIAVHVDGGVTPPVSPATSVDARLSDGAGATWVGQSIVNTTAQNQQLSQTLTGTGPLVYQLAVHQTNAATPVPLRVSLPNWNTFAADGWGARFLATDATGVVANPPADVTSAITSQNGWTCTPASNQEIVLRVEVSVPASAPAKQQKSFRFQVQAQDGTANPPADVVEVAAVQGGETSVQPDVSLERLSDGQSVESVGESVLNDDTSETLSTVVSPGQEQSYRVHIKNAGASAATFCVKMQLPLIAGAAPQPWAHQGWSASITLDGQTQDLASQLQSDSGWVTPSIAAGGDAVLNLSVSSTTAATTAPDGSFRVVAQNGTLSDAVVGQLATQSIVKIQWSLDNGQTWHDVTAATTLDTDQFAVVGLRVVKSNPNAGWPVPMVLGPTWKFQGQEVEGEEVWLHAKQVSPDGDVVQITPADSPLVTIRVAPGDAILTYDAE